MNKFKTDNLNDIMQQPTMNDIYSGNITTQVKLQEIEPKRPKNTLKKADKYKYNTTISTNKEGKIRYDKEGNPIYTKKGNTSITIKIDTDIADYLKNIPSILYQRGLRTDLTINAYVNNIIRQEMLNELKLDSDATVETIVKAWEKYKEKNRI